MQIRGEREYCFDGAVTDRIGQRFVEQAAKIVMRSAYSHV